MKCPIDSTELVMADRQGIEIDYCPQCRGVWLDRGELDKIIERTQAALPLSQSSSSQWTPTREADRFAHDDQRGQRDNDGHGRGHGSERDSKGRRRGGILGDIFDF